MGLFRACGQWLMPFSSHPCRRRLLLVFLGFQFTFCGVPQCMNYFQYGRESGKCGKAITIFLNCRCMKLRSMIFYFPCCSTSVLLDRRNFYHICLCAVCQFIHDGKLTFGGNDGLTRVRGKIVGVDAHHVGETGEFVVVAAVFFLQFSFSELHLWYIYIYYLIAWRGSCRQYFRQLCN